MRKRSSLAARFVALVLALGLIWPGTAVAGAHGFDLPTGDDARARTLLDEGRDAYHLGEYETAIRKLEEAHAIGDDPVVLYHLGLAYTRQYSADSEISHLKKARVVFLSYLDAAGPDATLVPTVQRHLAELEKILAATEAAHPTPPASRGQVERLESGRDRTRPGTLGRVGSLLIGSGFLGALTGSLAGFSTANRHARDGNDQRARRARNLGYLSLGLGGAAIVTGVVLAVLQAGRNKKTASPRSTARIRLGPTGIEMSF